MFTEERQQKILEILAKNNSVTITELEKIFSVSSETVRRDLLSLESQKKLLRVHGGAMSIENRGIEKSFDVRHTENIKQKNELALQAAEFLNEGDIIAVDMGSTSVVFCQLLVNKFKNLTVVTNSLMLFNILSENEGFKIILCSGEYERKNKAFMGTLAVEAIKKLHISKMFLAPSGISLKHGLTDYNNNYIEIQRAFMESSDKCFIMADSSKFEVGGLYSIDKLRTDMTVITDSELSDEIYNRYTDADIDIVRGENNG